MSCGTCKKPKRSKGFTLIELLVVIAIIAILAIIVLIALNNARTKARNSRAMSDVRSVVPALEMYNDNHDAYPAGPWASMCKAVGPTAAGGDGLLPAGCPSPMSGYAYQYCTLAGVAAPDKYWLRATGPSGTLVDLGDPTLGCM